MSRFTNIEESITPRVEKGIIECIKKQSQWVILSVFFAFAKRAHHPHSSARTRQRRDNHVFYKTEWPLDYPDELLAAPGWPDAPLHTLQPQRGGPPPTHVPGRRGRWR